MLIREEDNTLEGFTFVRGERKSHKLVLMADLDSNFPVRLTSDEPHLPGKNFADVAAVIIFADELLAKRVKNAFDHAAELCRKKEPF